MFFSDVKAQVKNIAKDYVSKQRQLIEERTSNNSKSRVLGGRARSQLNLKEQENQDCFSKWMVAEKNDEEKSKHSSTSIKTSNSLRSAPENNTKSNKQMRQTNRAKFSPKLPRMFVLPNTKN